MRQRFITLALAGFFILAGGSAFAQQTGARHPLFDRMDTDKDGFLTKEEVQHRFPQFTDEMFKQADANGDGKLSVAEWQTFARAHRAERKALKN